MSEDFEKSDFKERVVSLETKDNGFKVVRKRDSNGNASIIISDGRFSILLSNDKDDFGDNYEQAAFQLASLIDAIASEPCLLDEKK